MIAAIAQTKAFPYNRYDRCDRCTHFLVIAAIIAITELSQASCATQCTEFQAPSQQTELVLFYENLVLSMQRS